MLDWKFESNINIEYWLSDQINQSKTKCNSNHIQWLCNQSNSNINQRSDLYWSAQWLCDMTIDTSETQSLSVSQSVTLTQSLTHCHCQWVSPPKDGHVATPYMCITALWPFMSYYKASQPLYTLTYSVAALKIFGANSNKWIMHAAGQQIHHHHERVPFSNLHRAQYSRVDRAGFVALLRSGFLCSRK